MASRGFLIRFIDIGLIVLFGFLMISDIEASSRVELASAGENEEEVLPEEPDERQLIFVTVMPDGAFALSEPDTLAPAPGTVRGRDDLVGALTARRQRHEALGAETVVVIQPDPDSPVQFTVDVMDVADRLSLTKSLRMDIDVAPPPPGATP